MSRAATFVDTTQDGEPGFGSYHTAQRGIVAVEASPRALFGEVKCPHVGTVRPHVFQTFSDLRERFDFGFSICYSFGDRGTLIE